MLTSDHNWARTATLKATRILLVEDNTFNQQIAQEMLEEVGATVSVANNGIEALTLLQQAEFDCVLMDLQMPQMDGFEATRRIRAEPHLSNLPVLAMTATATTDSRLRCIDACMNDFISKPIQPFQLHQIIARWLPQGTLRQGPPLAPPIAPLAKRKPSDSSASIDWSVLAALIGNDPQRLRKFAIKFLESAGDGVREMEAAVARGKVQAVRDVAHRIKSAARSVGATSMADMCHDLEQLAHEQASSELARAQPMVDELHDQLQQIAEQIAQHVDGVADD